MNEVAASIATWLAKKRRTDQAAAIVISAISLTSGAAVFLLMTLLQALAYLAGQNAAVNWQDLMEHCTELSGRRLREQLALLDGVLFLGEHGARVTLMDPFRLRLRWMLAQEPARPRPEPAPKVVPVNEPETLSAYEILGLSPSASLTEIKTAYRKRVKECHPDLFAGMDQQAQALAERWTREMG